jgi:hypothetical protein
MKNNDFVFVTLTFNHEKYIIEHLESIKYQVENFGQNISSKIVISDDCSSDNTMSLIKKWCNFNRQLFNEIILIENVKNLGTCENFINTWKEIDTEYFKITAGDDLYSFENIFEMSKAILNYDIASYIPLYLNDGLIEYNGFAVNGSISSNIIYKSFFNRIRSVNVINAPSLFYSSKILSENSIIEFVKKFKLTEDLPLQLKMAEVYSPLKFIQKNKIIIYYRRTTNSTYLIKNKIFTEDKNKIFNYLIDTEKKWFNKLLVQNRVFCFNLNSKYLKNILNLNYYIYGILYLINFFKIHREVKNLKVDITKHKMHFNFIQKRANDYLV